MTLGIDDFKAKLSGGGARSTLFKVTLNYPAFALGDVELTSFMCKAAQLPGSTMAELPVPFRGRELFVAGDRTFEQWTVTVINDTNFKVRDALERWMSGINSHATNTGFTNPVDYQADLIVDQLDRDETKLKTYRFLGAFPIMLAPIDLAYENVNQIEEFTVDFRYQYWTSNTTDSYDNG